VNEILRGIRHKTQIPKDRGKKKETSSFAQDIFVSEQNAFFFCLAIHRNGLQGTPAETGKLPVFSAAIGGVTP